MQIVTQHLTTTKKFFDNKNQERTATVLNQFIEGCKKLDAGIIEKIIGEDDVFENKSKYQFLSDLKGLFDAIRSKSSNQFTVTVSNNHCKGCSFGRPIKIFSVYEIESITSMREFAFVIEVEKGILKDIYQCNLFR